MKSSRTKDKKTKNNSNWTTLGLDDDSHSRLIVIAKKEHRSEVGELRDLIEEREKKLGLYKEDFKL